MFSANEIDCSHDWQIYTYIHNIRKSLNLFCFRRMEYSHLLTSLKSKNSNYCYLSVFLELTDTNSPNNCLNLPNWNESADYLLPRLLI